MAKEKQKVKNGNIVVEKYTAPRGVANIEDVKGDRGWCIGNEDYRINDSGSFPIFFPRKSDVFKFVKRWSKQGRLEVDYNYFTGVRRVWNKSLGKYVTED